MFDLRRLRILQTMTRCNNFPLRSNSLQNRNLLIMSTLRGVMKNPTLSAIL